MQKGRMQDFVAEHSAKLAIVLTLQVIRTVPKLLAIGAEGGNTRVFDGLELHQKRAEERLVHQQMNAAFFEPLRRGEIHKSKSGNAQVSRPRWGRGGRRDYPGPGPSPGS